VCTTDRHHWPGPLATCSKHFNDGVDDVDDDDDDDDDDADDANTSMIARAACWNQNAGPILDPDSGRKSRHAKVSTQRIRLYVNMHLTSSPYRHDSISAPTKSFKPVFFRMLVCMWDVCSMVMC
jgi:hypothetical protein